MSKLLRLKLLSKPIIFPFLLVNLPPTFYTDHSSSCLIANRILIQFYWILKFPLPGVPHLSVLFAQKFRNKAIDICLFFHRFFFFLGESSTFSAVRLPFPRFQKCLLVRDSSESALLLPLTRDETEIQFIIREDHPLRIRSRKLRMEIWCL